MYYWKYQTKFKIYFTIYNVTDMTDKAINHLAYATYLPGSIASKSVQKQKISGCGLALALLRCTLSPNVCM